ncbi:MAG: N-acetylmuramoyl-L-alanine amidase [Opitutales bacterium]
MTLLAFADGLRLQAATRLSLNESGRYLGLQTSWVRQGHSARLANRWVSLVFERNQRAFTVDGLRVHLGAPVDLANGQLTITRTDYAKTLLPLLSPGAFDAPGPARHVVIDPGHGGKDAGAVNRSLGLREAEVALDVSLRLAQLLREAGYRVTLTRSDDRYIELAERTAIANRAQADFFISVHANAFSDARVQGLETFAYTPQGQPSTGRARLHQSDTLTYPANRNDTWNLLAAFYVQKSLVASLGGKDRGVKRARFTVLQSLNCPGLLAEIGFLSNPVEGGRLQTSAYRDQVARALCRGILTYDATLQRHQRAP